MQALTEPVSRTCSGPGLDRSFVFPRAISAISLMIRRVPPQEHVRLESAVFYLYNN